MDEFEVMDDAGYEPELEPQPEVEPELEHANEPSETHELRSALSARDEAHRAAITRLRQAFLESEPALDPALLAGDTVEELEASFASAKTMLAKLREAVRREQAAAIPAGGSGRAGERKLSAIEKIRRGLG